MRRRTKSTERQQEQEEDFAGVAADHSATRKFSTSKAVPYVVTDIACYELGARYNNTLRKIILLRLTLTVVHSILHIVKCNM